MKNSEFKVGSHILVQGHKGIVEEITRQKECKYFYKGKEGETVCLEDNQIEDMIQRGFVVEETGRTRTLFKIEFVDELKHWGQYNHGTYGCLDDYEEYGTW